jgi:ribosomal protein L7Ae-like RNA K-turn-binding protein
VKALCKENNIPLVTVKEGNSLGEYIGICKYDNNNNVRKSRKCSSVALRDIPADVTEEDFKAFLASV